MELLQSLFANSEAIFRFLVLNGLYSAILAFFVLCIKLIYPKIPRTLEYSLWCLVLVRLVLPPEFSISYSLGYIGHAWLDADVPTVLNASDWFSQISQSTLFEQVNLKMTWLNFLIILWAVCSSVVAYKFISLKLKLSKLLATAQPVEDAWLTKQINYWRREFKITRQIIVIDSDDFLSPFTFATFSPVIFIPRQLLQEGNRAVLGPIIAHELAHVKRLDAAWLLFQNIIQIFYCLNPIVWLAVRRLNSLREEICDQKVLNAKSISSEQYGKSLLHVLRLNIGRKSPELFATFFLSHKKVFTKRIAAIGRNRTFGGKMIYQYLTVIACALFFLPLSWQPAIVPAVVTPQEIIAKQESPFPDHIRKDFQAPVLLKENKQNKTSEELEIN